jgi:hypothetical protein
VPPKEDIGASDNAVIPKAIDYAPGSMMLLPSIAAHS